MFGSKIKTWMENHLGRQRKKGNKNKNVSPSDHITTGEQYKQKHAAKGFTLYNSNGCSSPYRSTTNSNTSSANHTGCNSSVMSSPNRRREVSPIQNHVSRINSFNSRLLNNLLLLLLYADSEPLRLAITR